MGMQKPLRKNLALAIDGGGIRGTMVAKALAVVVESQPDLFADRPLLLVGTSTGSIISAGLILQPELW
jgi:patatin-like phospholipase/acyl hydrolase